MSATVGPSGEKSERAERPFAVTASSRLLLTQAAGLLVLAWLLASSTQTLNLFDLWAAALWFLLGLYAAWVSLRFLRERAGAHSQAILVQGYALGFALITYAAERPIFVYPIMLLSILILLYLQHPDVRERFALDKGAGPIRQ